MNSCYACDHNDPASFDPTEQVYADATWRIALAFDSSLPGWMCLGPRMLDVPKDRRGAAVFGYLGADPADQPTTEERLRLAVALGESIGTSLAAA